ncbi:MAG: hypothetical protein R2727_10245 [Bacteroidales bacterium]
MVHNGIIENSDEIKEILARNGYSFVSETDTEVLLNLIDYEYLKSGKNILGSPHKGTGDSPWQLCDCAA